MLILFIKFVGKESEVDFAVGTVLPEVGMVIKRILFGVFENENAVFCQHIALKNNVG